MDIEHLQMRVTSLDDVWTLAISRKRMYVSTPCRIDQLGLDQGQIYSTVQYRSHYPRLSPPGRPSLTCMLRSYTHICTRFLQAEGYASLWLSWPVG